MFFRPGTTPWFFQDHFDTMIDFCFWVLEADGLHAAPFEHHTGGDGTLQVAGLDATGWRAWMHEVVSTHSKRKCDWHYNWVQKASDMWASSQREIASREEKSSEASRHTMLESLRGITLDLLPAFAARPLFPADFWYGRPEVGQRLSELWERYTHTQAQRNIHARKHRKEELNGEWELLSPPGDPRPLYRRKTPEGEMQIGELQQALAPYHSHLDGLNLYYIEYPQQIDYLVPPLSVVMTLVDGKLDYKNIIPRAVEAAKTLVALTSL